MFLNKAHIENAMVVAEMEKTDLLSNIFYILNNGVAMGNVPEDASEIISTLSDLLSAGGMQGFMWTISIIICAMCFGGIMDCTGMMGSMTNVLLKMAKKEPADWFWQQNSHVWLLTQSAATSTYHWYCLAECLRKPLKTEDWLQRTCQDVSRTAELSPQTSSLGTPAALL